MSNPAPTELSKPSSPLPVLALVLGVLIPLAGAIIGHVALSQMKSGRITSKDKGLAKAGVIIGWVFTGLFVLYLGAVTALALWFVTEGIDPYP